VLRCVIDEAGIAENIEVVRSLDPGLDANAVTAVTQFRFAPGKKDGKPVRVAASIEINFRLL
jgi:TonB family protein